MRQPRHLLIPNANNPELLVRLLEQVARGIRSTRGLAEALGVEPRTVGYYTQAAQWLALLDGRAEPTLTPLGLELVYAGPDRPHVYARAVWANPFVADLLTRSDDRLPTVDLIVDAIRRADPRMAPSTARRRATAVRSLIAPAMDIRRVRPPRENRQMVLPLGFTATPTADRLDTVGKRADSPEAYRYLLATFLDHGELHLRHVRGLLDRAGADRAPIGGYVDRGISRGDLVRHGDTLVLTAAAAGRPELAANVNGILLSDPDYRAYLDACASADPRCREQHRRFAPWDLRLFGRTADPSTLRSDLERILVDRSVDGFPLAVPGIEPPLPEPGPFLERWECAHLRVACPPTLAQLQGGVAAVNRLLRERRSSPDAARPPSLVDPVRVVHGGLLHPGEPPPRAVPDTRSLRARVLTHAPYASMVAALLLVHRHRPDHVLVHRSRGRWRVRWGGQRRGPVLQLLDRFARARAWIVARRPSGGLPDAALFDALEALGIVEVLGKQAVLSERFFGQLCTAPEESELHARLAPLAHAMEAFLGGAS